MRSTTYHSTARLARTAAGWLLIAVGFALVPLPGPGALVVVAGLRTLVPHHPWAARLYEPVRDRAVRAAKTGVATWPRVALSAVGPTTLVLVAVAYAHSVHVPEVRVAGAQIGPQLPFQGIATTTGLLFSAIASVAVLAVTTVRWGPTLGLMAPLYRARRHAARVLVSRSATTGWSLAVLLPAAIVCLSMSQPHSAWS